MGPYFDTRFVGTLLLRTRAYLSAWLLIRRRFDPPFLLTAFQILRIEHMLLHQTEDALKVAALRGYQDWQRHFQEGVFQVRNLDWEGANRLALELNRRSLEHRMSPMHFLEAASASLSEASHFVSFDPNARAAASMVGIRILPENVES